MRNRKDYLMTGNDFSSALTYHEATKHSEVSIGASAHYLDWDNKPAQFKEYENLPSVTLPRNFPHPERKSITAIRGELRDKGVKQIDLEDLAQLLFVFSGNGRKMLVGNQFYYMRAASATGALYPIELYVISGRIPGLEAGVYHFNPLHFSLVKLREGDYRSELDDAGSPDSLSSPFTLAFTSLAWRNAWKYEARSYRHWFWDSGVIVANLLATSNSAGLATKVALGFVDSDVDQLLRLETRKEATVALAVVGAEHAERAPRMQQPITSLSLGINPLSQEEVDYSTIWETNEAAQLESKSETDSWRRRRRLSKRTIPPVAPTFPLGKLEEDSSPSLDEVILLRGSTRKFARKPVSFDHLSTIIQASATKIPADFLPENETLIDFYFIDNEVQGLPPGSYFYNVDTNSVEQLKVLRNRSMSGYLCLGQQLFSDASVVFFLMTELNPVFKSLGNRGYRAAQFEAGIHAGKIFRSGFGLGLGAFGATFFCYAVLKVFSPPPRGTTPTNAPEIESTPYKSPRGTRLT